jgi:hypothetical protein
VSSSALALVQATGLVRRASDHAPEQLGAQRILPVLPELRDLLPGKGLRRGTTIAVSTGSTRMDRARSRSDGAGVRSVGATTLLLALLAEASRAGSWCTVVGMPALGAIAAAGMGVALDRLALVPHPGPDWPSVVAALLDGIDIVVIAAPGPVSASIAARLAARARQRGTVLVSFGQWDRADVTLDAVSGQWHGLGSGRGRLKSRLMTVSAQGRGAAAGRRRVEVWLPAREEPVVVSRPGLTVIDGSWSPVADDEDLEAVG